MRIPSAVVDQYIYFVAVDSTDYVTRETGLSSFTVYRSRNGAAPAAMSSPTVNEVESTYMEGVYELLLDEDMTIAAGNDSEEMVFHITKTGMAPVTRTIELYRPKITAGYTLGVNASGHASRVTLCDSNTDMRGTDSGATAANLATVDTVVDAIKVVTDALPDSGALSSLATATNLATVDTVVDGIQTDLSNGTDGLGALKSLIDTVDTVVDAVKVVTDALPNSGALTDLATASALTTVDTVVDAVKVKTDQLTFTVSNQVDANALTGGGGDSASTIYTYFTDGTREDVFKADVSALATASSVSALNDISTAEVVTSVWDTAQSSHTTAGTFGKYLDAQVSSASAPTASAVADAVWDELIAGHAISGSTGASLSSASSAGDPWTTALPGSYTGSQAGKIMYDIKTDGGAGASLTYITGYTPDRVERSNATVFVGESVLLKFETRDANNKTVDLSAKTMYVVIETAAGKDIVTIADGSLTKTTTTVSYTVPTTVTDSANKSVFWALRDNTTHEVYLRGTLYIQSVASTD